MKFREIPKLWKCMYDKVLLPQYVPLKTFLELLVIMQLSSIVIKQLYT